MNHDRDVKYNLRILVRDWNMSDAKIKGEQYARKSMRQLGEFLTSKKEKENTGWIAKQGISVHIGLPGLSWYEKTIEMRLDGSEEFCLCPKKVYRLIKKHEMELRK